MGDLLDMYKFVEGARDGEFMALYFPIEIIGELDFGEGERNFLNFHGKNYLLLLFLPD